MKKPIIIYAEGAGPFRSIVGRLISRFIFKRCAYISVRDKISLEYLVNLGIEKEKIDLVADSAFLLKPSPKNLNYRKKGKRLIGVAVSKLVSAYGFSSQKGENSYKCFLDFMANLIDWMIESLNASIIMITHAIQAKRDDYQTALDILEKVKNKNEVKILSKNFGAAEFKKAISHCDLVIASRIHAAVAALSNGIPAVGIGYSHKAKGIYEQLDLEDLVIDIKELNWGITNKIKRVLSESNFIKNKIKKKIPFIKKQAEKPAFEVTKILNKSSF